MDDAPLPPSERVRPLLRVRQVREFTDAPVARDALDAIADAGRWSGSSQNTQPWRFVIVTEPETLKRLGEAGLPSTRSLLTAAAAIAICLIDEKGKAVPNAFDEGRAAERMLIAASLVGVAAGIAWLPSDARPVGAEVLALPPERFVRTVVALGHPTDAASEAKSEPGQARLPREETVFVDRFGSS